MLRSRGIAVLVVLLSALAAGAQKRHAVRFTPSGLAAVPDTYAGRKGDALVVDAAKGVLANDLEPGRKTLVALLVTNVTHGSLTFHANGSFTYTHDGSEARTDSFTYKVSNGSAESVPATVKIIIGDSTAVTGAADTYSLNHGATLTVASPGILGNDAGPAGSTLTATLASSPSNGTLTLDSGGGFTYEHSGTNTTTDSFTYYASYAGVSSAVTTVSLRIAVDIPPTVTNQTYSAVQNNALNVSAPGVLTNAHDPDSDNLTATLVTNPSRGTVTLNADGSFVYTPAVGYFGSDTFTYRASDGIFSSLNVGTATINISGAPVANADSYSASASTGVSIGGPGVLSNDVTGGATITSYGASTGLEQPVIGSQTSTSRGGLVTLLASGGFTYSPPATSVPADSFSYILSNSAGSALATVTLNLYSMPSATSDSYDVATGITRSVGAPGILSNDTTNGASIAGKSNPLRGALTLNDDGSFVYTPNAGYVGNDSFTYTITNFSGSASAVVTLRVLASPVAVADSYSNSSSTFTAPAPGVLSNDTTSLATIVSYGVTGTEQTGIGSAAATAQGGSVILNASGAVNYTPPPNFSGADTFKYTLSNYAGSTSATVTITTYNTPAAAADSYFCPRNTPTVVNSSSGVLANDTSNGGKIISFGATGVEQVTLGSAAGTVAGGSITLALDGSFTYLPPMLYVGTDSFRYVLSNAAGSVSGIVTLNVLAAPVAANDTYQASVNATLSVPFLGGITANDTLHFATLESYGKTGSEQTNIGQLTATAQNGTLSVNADGSFSYTPATSFTGTDSFAYVLSSVAGTSMANVTITVSNSPIALADSFQIAINTARTIAAPGVLSNDTLSGGSILGYGAAAGIEQPNVGSPTGTAFGGSIMLHGDGSFTYTPPPAFSGTDRFLYRLQNGSGNSTAMVSLQVFPTPTAGADNYSTPKNTRLIIGAAGPTILANDGTNGAAILSYGATGSEQSTLGQTTATAQGGSVAVNGDGTFTYTPATNFAGTDTFRYTISNYSGAAVGTVTITVTAGPIANADTYTSSRGITLTVYAANGLLANDTLNGATLFSYGTNGVEQQTLGVNAPTAQGGTVKISADGSFTYDPAPGFTGTDTFRYVLFSAGGAAFGNVTITIAAAPVAANDNYATSDNITLIVPAPGVFANDQGNGGAVSSYGKTGTEQTSLGSSTATSQGGTVSLSGDGSFSYTPATNFTGTDTFAYVLTNTSGNSMATVAITVASSPIAAADNYSVARNGSRTVAAPGVLSNDTLNGATMVSYGSSQALQTQTIVGTNTPTAMLGTIALHANGSLTYTAPPNFSGNDTAVYRLQNSAGSAYGVITFAVAAPPAALSDTYSTAPNSILTVGLANAVTINDQPNGANVSSYGAGTGTEQTAVGSPTATSQGGLVALNANGTFVYTTPASFTGTDTFKYVLTNGAGSSTAVVSITVSTLPAVNHDTYTVPGDRASTTAAPGVLSNDSLAGGTVKSYGAGTGAENAAIGATVPTQANGTIALHGDGSFTYTPPAVLVPTDSFKYILSNAAGNSTVATVTLTLTGAPVAKNDAYNASMNVTLAVNAATGVLANDSVNGATIVSYGKTGTEQTSLGTATTTSSGGTASLNANGSFSYTPLLNSTTADTFAYVLANAAGTSVATVQITVAATPNATGDSYAVARNGSRTQAAPGVLANDTLNGATIVSYGAFQSTQQTVIGAAVPTAQPGGSVALRLDGSFSYVAPPNFSGTDSFVYRIQNSAGDSFAMVTFAVAAPPAALSDSYTTAVNTILTVDAPNAVTVNDQTNGGLVVSYGASTGAEQSVVGSPTATSAGGTVALNANGTFVYTTPASFSGSDTFKYILANEAGSSTATVTIHVSTTPATDDSYAVAGNRATTIAAPGVLSNDSATGSVIASYGALHGNEQLTIGTVTPTRQSGAVVLNANGSFTYTPPGAVTATDSFKYVLTGSSGTATATVSLTLYLPPVARNDSYDARLNTTLLIASATGVTFNDDLQGATIVSYGKTGTEQTAIGSSTATSAAGAVSLNPNGSFSYTPALNYGGTDTFSYVLSNTAGTSIALVQIDVVATPVAVGDSYALARNGTRSVSAPGVLSNDTANGATIVSYGANSATQQSTMGAAVPTMQPGGTVALHADGSFTYSAPPNFTGNDSFVYRLQNSAGGVFGTVTLSIAAPPAAVADNYAVAVNSILDQPAPGVAGNDLLNGALITSYGATTGLEQTVVGTPAVTSQGGLVSLNAAGSFVYTTPPNFSGSDTFTYYVSNAAGSASALVTISVERAPLAVPDAYTTNQNQTLTVAAPGVLSNDTQNNAALSVVGTPTKGTLTLRADGSFTYVPNAGATGADAFTYRLQNVAASSNALVSLTIIGPPAASDDTYDGQVGVTLSKAAAQGILINDTLSAGGVIASYGAVNGTEQATVGAAAATAQGGSITISSDGSFSYTPKSGFGPGTDSMWYVLSNSAGTSKGKISIVLVNPPSAVADSYRIEDALHTPTTNILANDNNGGHADIVSYGPSTGMETLISAPGGGQTAGNQTVKLNANGTFTITNPNNFFGTDTFRYRISNAAGTSTATVTLASAGFYMFKSDGQFLRTRTASVWPAFSTYSSIVQSKPGAAAFKGKLYAFFTNDTERRYAYSSNGTTWQDAPALPDSGTFGLFATGEVYAPSAVTYANHLWVLQPVQRLTFNGIFVEHDIELWLAISENGTDWSGWARRLDIDIIGPASPVVFNNELYVFYHRGHAEDLVFAFPHHETGELRYAAIEPERAVDDVPLVQLEGAPAAVAHNGTLYVYFVDRDSHRIHYTTSTDGIGWTQPVDTSVACTDPYSLSATSFGGDLYLHFHTSSAVRYLKNHTLQPTALGNGYPGTAVFP